MSTEEATGTAVPPRVGSIVYATDQGLGVLARSFHDHGLIDRLMLLSRESLENHYHWYPSAQRYHPDLIDEFLDDIDVLLILEKLHDWEPAIRAARAGVRVALIPLYEITPEDIPVRPDVYICPSRLDYDVYFHRGRTVFLPIPVDVPWRQRRRVRRYVHNAGNGYSFFRNGTYDLLRSLALIESPVELVIRIQGTLWEFRETRERRVEIEALLEKAADDTRVTLVRETVPYRELWRDGDAFVFPERYNGLSLPLQEARAAGLLVIATDRYPNNTWLPREPLIPTSGHEPVSTFGIEVESAIVAPEHIARTIDRWYDADITDYSLAGRDWAREHSWSRWRPVYVDVLAGRDPQPPAPGMLHSPDEGPVALRALPSYRHEPDRQPSLGRRSHPVRVPISFAHVVSPVAVPPESDLHLAQPVTFQSMLDAKRCSVACDVELMAASYPKDEAIVPVEFSKTDHLSKSILDFLPKEAQTKKLPLLAEILERAYSESTADYVVFTKSDIGLMPFFFDFVANRIGIGYDGLTITRRTISSSGSLSLPEMYSRLGRKHPGFDCFVFPRSAIPDLELGNVCLGAIPVGKLLLLNLQLWCKSFSVVDDAHVTFHLGRDRVWLDPKYRPNELHNKREALRSLRALETRYGAISCSRCPLAEEIRGYGPVSG